MLTEDMEISCRTYNQLKKHGITTAAQIMELGEGGLLMLRNIGRWTVYDIVSEMRLHGYAVPPRPKKQDYPRTDP